jgi:hypothetical protein
MNTNMWSMPQIVVCSIALPLISMGGFAEGSPPYLSLRSNLKAVASKISLLQDK